MVARTGSERDVSIVFFVDIYIRIRHFCGNFWHGKIDCSTITVVGNFFRAVNRNRSILRKKRLWGFQSRWIRICRQNWGGIIFGVCGSHFCTRFRHNLKTVGCTGSATSPLCFSPNFTYRRCHEKTSYVSNYAFFTLMHKWVDREEIHHFEKLQNYTSSDEIGITHRGVSIIGPIGPSDVYRPIHAITW